MMIRRIHGFATMVLVSQLGVFGGCSSSGTKAGTGGTGVTSTGGATGVGTGGSTGTGGATGVGTGGSPGTGGTSPGSGGGAGAGGRGGGGTLGGAGGSVGVGGLAGSSSAPDAGAGGSAGAGVACPGAGKSLHFQDDLNGVRTTSMQVLADLGTDLPIANAARTIEMWLYMEGNESWKSGHSIIEYGGVGRCNAFGIDGGDNQLMNPAQFDPFTFSSGGPCTGDNNVAITPAPPRTGWLHVALAYAPAGIGGQAGLNFLFTVNGVAQPIPARMQTGALLTMQTVLSIGSGQDASSDTGNGFTGRIDEVRVWNVGRTNQEIMDNYRLILHGDEPGLVAYYHFDDGAGTTPRDASLKHHDAVFATNMGRPVPTWVDSTGLTLTCKP
jgi:hypothetical protein